MVIVTIPIANPEAYTVPAKPAFTPDRLGVRRVLIDVDRTTSVYRVSLTPCPATAEEWGPQDAPNVSTGNLLAELLAAPDTAEKLGALQALQRIEADLRTIAGYLIALRSTPPPEPEPEPE